MIDRFGQYIPDVIAPESPPPAGGGSGSPEGVVVASPFQTWFDEDANLWYVKESGIGTNTGWVAAGGSGGGGTDFEALTDAATVTIDASKDGGILTTLGQATNFANPTGTPVANKRYILRIKSTTARALTWGAKFRGSDDGALPSSTQGSSKTDYFLFSRNETDDKYDFISARVGF